MRIGWINWNNKKTDTLGIYVTGAGVYNAAEADVTAYQIPGRNGDLIISNGRYKNIEVAYPAFVPSDFETRVQAIRDWMRSSVGYAKLEDNYDTSHFRMARPVNVLKFSPVQQEAAANLQLVFDCKPQRWLTGSDSFTSITSGQTLTNPTNFDAFPLIKVVNPNGNFSLTVTISGYSAQSITDDYAVLETVYFDSETQNIYNSSGTFRGSSFTRTNGLLPVLYAGKTATITWSGASSVSIAPRWWEL